MNKVKKVLFTALFATLIASATGAFVAINDISAKAENVGGMKISITDGIIVKYYTVLDAGTQNATAVFDSEVDSLDATVVGTNVGSDTWEFIYDKVTPQYVDQTFSISIGGQAYVSDYSVLDYLTNVTEKSDATDEEKAVAQDLIFYGQAAKAYKLGGEVTAQPSTTFSGTDEHSLTGTSTQDNMIKSATVVFDSIPAIKFNFVKTSDAAVVKVDDEDVTDQLVEKDGLYTYVKKGIYAVDFDKQYKVEFINGDDVQTLLYSINDYAARIQSSANESMRTLARALWCYGSSAEALLTQQNTYVVVEEPTYTQTGLARNGKGQEKILPVLNGSNYTYVQKSTSGGAYAYSDANGGIATFTHEETGVIINKTITPDTITANYFDFNCVDVHFKVSGKFFASAKYEDGTYVFTVNEEKSIPNMSNLTSSWPNVKITGSGSLAISTKYGTNLNGLTVDGVDFSTQDSITVNGNASFANANVSVLAFTASKVSMQTVDMTISGKFKASSGGLTINDSTVTASSNLESYGGLTIDKQSEVSVMVASGDAIVMSGTGKVFGKLNLKDTGTASNTGIKFATMESSLSLYRTTELVFDGFEYAFGQWADTSSSVRVYMPYNYTTTTADLSEGETARHTAVYNGKTKNIIITKTCNFVAGQVWLTARDSDIQVLTQPTTTTTGSGYDEIDDKNVVLPVISKDNYTYSTTSTATTFSNSNLGVSFSIAVSTITVGDATYSDMIATLEPITVDGGTVTYENDAFVLTSNAGATASVGAITASALTIAAGQYTVNGNLNATKLVVKSGATINMTGVINSDDMLTEAGSELNVTANKDTIRINNAGTAKLNGTVCLTDSTGDNKTAFWLSAGATVELSESSRITIKGYCYAVGKFSSSDNGIVKLPTNAEQKSDGYYVGETCIFNAYTSQGVAKGIGLCNITVTK